MGNVWQCFWITMVRFSTQIQALLAGALTLPVTPPSPGPGPVLAGTLTPIVNNPDQAVMTPQVTCVLPERVPQAAWADRTAGHCRLTLQLHAAPDCCGSRRVLVPQTSAPPSIVLTIALFYSMHAADEGHSAAGGALVPHCHHQRQGAGQGGGVCAAARALLCWKPWHGHSRPEGEFLHQTQAVPVMHYSLYTCDTQGQRRVCSASCVKCTAVLRCASVLPCRGAL